MFKAIKDFFSRLSKTSIRPKITLSATEAGATLSESTGKSLTIAWDDITAIVVFKRDLYTVDQVCMAIVAADGPLEIDEEFDNWSGFIADIKTYLPDSVSFADWFMYVAFPAFESKPLVIYKKGEKVDLPVEETANQS